MPTNIIGYLHGHDSSACLVQDGRVVAFIEEERLIRQKHAVGIFPVRAIEGCLKQGGISLADVDCFAFGYDAPRFDNGEIAAFYEKTNQTYPPDPGTKGWQQVNLRKHSSKVLSDRLHYELQRYFGSGGDIPLEYFPHHESHAHAAFHYSGFDEALILIVDGSGDHQCTTIWKGSGTEITQLHEINIPHSLGWFYSAITEFLGFEAYDGEYKVMGLAPLGKPNADIRAKLQQVLHPGPSQFDYVLNRDYIHNGKHSYSTRFTDELAELLGVAPRAEKGKIEQIHMDIAYEAQRLLEECVFRLLTHFRETTGLRHLTIGGGVGQNVKLNGRIRESGMFDDISLFPIPSDSGTATGAALGVHQRKTGKVVRDRLRDLYWGPSFTDAQIENELKTCRLTAERPQALASTVADMLASGKIVGWFQGEMEAGARALGHRSILADPRHASGRDRVNEAIKYREIWRPFCPSMTADALERFATHPAYDPFMITAFTATEEAKALLPAVIHVDGTMRVQIVEEDTNPLFYELLREFEKKAGVSVLLNTSFNIKGEPIVCTPRDAIRTFYSTGLDALILGPYVLSKSRS